MYFETPPLQLKANSGFYLNILSDGAVQIHLQSGSCADVRVPYTVCQICSLSKPGSIQKVVFSDLVQGNKEWSYLISSLEIALRGIKGISINGQTQQITRF